ncbi:MAG: glycosyl transferase family 2 [Gemmatimonadetes bacterium]|nr:glycosyl transferase family 2 [Gemmatimonadota bacterium]
MTSLAVPLLWSLPWVVPPIAAAMRSRRSRALDEFSAVVPDPAPPVSVIIPARNERRNIERCVRSVLASRYPALEVIVVDDHSTDGTGEIAGDIARGDARLRVVPAPDLPAGWFGKQWACATGAAEARGELLLFTDADTRHGDDLLPRAVNAMRARGADLFTIAGHQETHSFWERVIQPQLFALLSIRYGGTEHVNDAKRPADVIANGQYILVRRDAYDAIGGHALVRDQVAEDLALAQEFFRAGRRVVLMLAMRQFSTHMYASLGEIVRGWRKNIYAGGRNAMLGGAAGRLAYPFVLIALPLTGLLPPLALVLSAAGVLSDAWMLWSAVVVAVALLFWIAVYRFIGEPVWYALLYPLGLAMLGYIAVGAVVKGRKVEWKERKYLSS